MNVSSIPSQTMRTLIYAPDIECDNCARSITETLGKLAGVQSVSVDVDAKNVQIAHDQKVSAEVLIGKLDEIGFPATRK